MILGIQPAQDLASLAIQDALAAYGRTLVSPGDPFVALQAIDEITAKIPRTEHPLVAEWAEFIRRELRTRAIMSLGYRAPACAPGFGRHVLVLLLADRSFAAAPLPNLDARADWLSLGNEAREILFGCEDDRPTGQIVRQVRGPRRRIGAHSFVGLGDWRRELLRRDFGYSYADRSVRT